jgi:hypothetical protein
VLFIHEVHTVVGRCADQFEDAYRSGWMSALARGSDARLLWYLDLAHGSGLAYRVVTVTGVTDGAAWARLADRVSDGDLQSWARHRDGLQHRSQSRTLIPLPWSPELPPLAEVPTDPVDNPPTLYMEDTMWPFPGRAGAYCEAAGAVYRRALEAPDARMHMSVDLAAQTMPGAGRHPEVTLFQTLSSLPRLVDLLTTDLPAEVTAPGSWMHQALELRDQWRSALLRTASWSPLPGPGGGAA